MNYQVVISETAETEAQDAYLNLLRLSPDFAGEWYDGLLDAIASLDIFPNRCPLAPENDSFPNADIRHLIYRKGRTVYRILYCVLPLDTVRILHVRHGARRYGSSDVDEE